MKLFKKALVFLLGWVLCSVFASVDVKTYIPVKASKYIPMLKAEKEKFWSDHPLPEFLPALAEQESCLSLTHSRCWDPTSQLKTAREEGAGIAQTTRTFRADGSIRFDTLSDMRKQYPSLSEWSWDNVYKRPDLQLRSLVLLNRANYQKLDMVKDTRARLDFTDSAYNSGLGSVQNKRRACGLKKDCNPQIWFDNVEKICLTGTTPLYGKRTACDINKEHVYYVDKLRSNKYKVLMAK